MTTLSAGTNGVVMASQALFSPIASESLTQITITNILQNGYTELYTGSFVISNNTLVGGAATGYQLLTNSGDVSYYLTGANIPSSALLSFQNVGDANGLRHALLQGHDTYKGSSATDVLIGQGGNDTFIAGQGTESFITASGNNTVIGASGVDTVLFQGSRSAYAIADNGDGSITVTDSVTSRNGIDHIASVEQLQFADKTVFVANPDQANIARIYSAGLNRPADAAGLNGWEAIYANNVPASAKAQGPFVALAKTSGGYSGSLSIAAGFTNSTEFQHNYGSVDNPTFVGLMYNNVLGRAAMQSETAAWVSLMTTGDSTGQIYTKEMVLVGFAESPENIAKTGHDWLFATSA